MKILSKLILVTTVLTLSSCAKQKNKMQESHSEVFFNHTYFHSTDKSFLEILNKAGFSIADNTTDHPGSIQSYFIFIGDLMPGPKETYLTPAYLEFSFIRDPQTYLKNNEAYAETNDPKSPLKWKGYSLGASQGLKKYSEKIAKKLKTELKHKNYNWKQNSTDQLPGWNFLVFPESPFNYYFYTWFTESDSNHPNKNRSYESHSNGAKNISGIVLDIQNEDQTQFLELITDNKFKDGILSVGKNHFIYRYNLLTKMEKALLKNKEHQYKAVLIEADTKKLDSIPLPYEKPLFRGKKVKIVRFPKTQWDIFLLAN